MGGLELSDDWWPITKTEVRLYGKSNSSYHKTGCRSRDITCDTTSCTGQEYGVVHYDLNAAKPALQIQSTEAPKYDNLFICFGPFHIMMSYFGSVGYLIDSSGGPEILVDADVLASGSLTGFLKGKHFNRCKRLHLLFATALQVLHFKNFLEEFGPISQELATRMDELKRSPGPAMLECIEGLQEYKYLMESYEHSVQQTLDGEHGNTARFWMTYITLVKAYLMLSCACRTSDVDLFVYALSQMCPVFFAASHQNYARWMVRYCLRLLNIDNTHLGLRAAGRSIFSATDVNIIL